MVKKKRIVKEKGDLKLKHREFWIFFAIMFLLSVLTILNYVGDSNVTGFASLNAGKHIQTIAYMNEGEFHFEVRNIGGLDEATLQLIETVKGGKIVFEEDDSITFDGNYYLKFKVSSDEEEKYGNIKLQFKVKENDLLNVGIAKGDLRLFVNNKELDTTFIKQEAGYFFYESTSSEFGNFVLGRTDVDEVFETVSEEEPVKEKEKYDFVGKAITQPISEKVVKSSIGLIISGVFLVVIVIIVLIVIGQRRKK